MPNPDPKPIYAGTDQAKKLLQKAFKRQPIKKKPDPLMVKAQNIFNTWIRKRDEGRPCINCGQYRTLQAGHLYPTSTHSHLRFNEHNVNGECKKCNYFDSQSHQDGYRRNLEQRIGVTALAELDRLAAFKTTVLNARFIYLDIIAKYK